VASIRKNPDELKVMELCEAHLDEKGFNIVDIDVRRSGQSLLRFFIERKPTETEKKTSIEDCAVVSRCLGEVLEASDLFVSGFELEVSSPGLDRRLRQIGDFENFVGKKIKLKLSESIPGIGKQPSGILKKVDSDQICILSDINKEFVLPLNNILQANAVWEAK
jgi:ribosome maturation factor RimP